MTFLNPTLALVGLACVAVPIIIHILMRRRRRPVAWAAMRFLLEAYKKQRRRLNLEQILLLAARCLLVALLALALGKPILGAAGLLGESGPRTVYLLIDNGLASSATSAGNTSALESHKAAAESLIRGLDASRGDRVGIIAMGAPADPVVMPPTSDAASALAALRALKPTDAATDVAGALALVHDARTSKDERRASSEEFAVVLSGFRAGSANVDAPLRALGDAGSPPIRLIAATPAGDGLDNLSVQNAEPTTSIVVVPSGEGESADIVAATQVRVELRRTGPSVQGEGVTKVRARVVAANDDAESTSADKEHVVAWKPGEETTTASLLIDMPAAKSLRAGAVVRVAIDRDAIAGDNILERPLEVRDRLIASLIAPPLAAGRTTIDKFTPGDWLALALEPTDDGSLRARRSGETTIRVIDPTRDLADARGGALGVLAGSDVVVVARPDLVDAVGWRRIAAAADAGAVVLLSPAPMAGAQPWGEAFSEALAVEWTVKPESKEFPAGGIALAPERSKPAGADMLGAIAGELTELTQPVRVFRVLEPTAPKAGAFDTLLALADGTPLVIASARGTRSSAKSESATPQALAPTPRGLIVYLTAAPDLAWTDLPAKPLMVPLIQELVRQGVGRSVGSRVAYAGQGVTLPAGAVEIAPLADDASAPLSADAAGRVTTPLRQRGLWQLRGLGGTRAGVLAINADPRAGRTDIRSKDEIAKWLAPAGAVEWLPPTGEGVGGGRESTAASVLERRKDLPPISLPLLIAVGVIALAELVMARYFSHAKIDDQDLGDAAKGEAPAAPAAGKERAAA